MSDTATPRHTPASSLATPPAPAASEAGRRKGELHGTAASQLRDMIITGALAPGERLNERELCERLGVSRTPIREAIRTLTQEGLLHAFPNRSPVVAPLDAEETRALVDVLAAIEGLAGELTAARVTDQQLAELGMLHDSMLRRHSRDDLPGYFEANRAFHRAIIAYSGNPVLAWIWELLALRVDRARYASNLWPARWKEAVHEHGEILARLAARDAAALGEAMREHVRKGLSVVVSALEHGALLPGEEAERKNAVVSRDARK